MSVGNRGSGVEKNQRKNLVRTIVVVSLPSALKKWKFFQKISYGSEKKNSLK